MPDRFLAKDLIDFGTKLFHGAGMPEDRARIVGKLLVEGDLIGQTTHGLAQASAYLAELESGMMAKDGEPEVLSDRGAVAAWDGNCLSGVWLVHQAIETAAERVKTHGIFNINIRRSHHIACLAAFLPLAIEQGYMLILTCSDPARGGVAPYGSFQPLYTPDPIAVGYPTNGDPVMIDISASTTTLGMAERLQASGGNFDGNWLIDNQGNPSSDPSVLQTDPPGALLPLGGADRGHKGFGLGLMVEALTSGLGGYGRADRPNRWGASVFLQLIDPDAFGGRSAFERETGWLADAARASAVAPGKPPVRLPGDSALARKRAALRDGVDLHQTIMPQLSKWAAKLGVEQPNSI